MGGADGRPGASRRRAEGADSRYPLSHYTPTKSNKHYLLLDKS